MLPALSAAAMREADRFTIEELGIPGFTLMESAGRAAVGFMLERYGVLAGRSVACICGKGNNGGDGLVVARQLLELGTTIDIFLMAPPESLSEDAAHNFAILENLARLQDMSHLRIQILQDLATLPVNPAFDILVDGLLGTGVTRNLNDRYSQVVAWMNAQTCPIVALDLPSGLHADTGVVLGNAIHADLTVSMGAMKAGLLLGDGPVLAGSVKIAEIGIPSTVIRKTAEDQACPFVVTNTAIRSWLPRRKHTAHKYGVGMALVVAGSKGLTGAATLASTAAARSGAGAVVCASPENVQPVLASKMTEVMTLAIPSTDEGIDAETALGSLEEPLAKANSLLVGCGIGRLPATQQFVQNLLKSTDLPLVLDADGLHAVADQTDIISRYANGRWILTPHLGEFRRLAGETVDISDRLATVRKYAQEWNCVLVLKGAPTVVGTPDGSVFINPTINPALATAGSGDVLAGLCAGFLAQGLSPIKSTLSALYLGGKAADSYTSQQHLSTMLATDLIAHFCQVMNDFRD